jgi:hypothetical protein
MQLEEIEWLDNFASAEKHNRNINQEMDNQYHYYAGWRGTSTVCAWAVFIFTFP